MYTHLVVPLDGSAFAEHALPYAALLARHGGATVDLVLVHTSYSVATMDAAIHETVDRWQTEQREQEATYLHEVVERLAREAGVAARPVLLMGPVVPSLEAHVRSSGADLVVMTTHGRSGLQRMWLGSVAEALVRHLDTPVLLVRPHDGEPGLAEDRPLFRHLAIALDGSALGDHAVDTALALADPETRFTLLRVVAPPRAPTSPYLPHAAHLNQQLLADRHAEAAEYLIARADRLRAAGREVETRVLLGYHAAQAIVHWAEANGADGIALSTPGRNPALRLLLGSVQREVVREGAMPVLVG
jgi:nucleotide-binding universal stress UspA family protein